MPRIARSGHPWPSPWGITLLRGRFDHGCRIPRERHPWWHAMRIGMAQRAATPAERRSSLPHPGPRGAKRRREIRGPARNWSCSGSISLLEGLDPGSARRLRHRLFGTRGCERHLCENVIYAQQRHLWGRRHVWLCSPALVRDMESIRRHLCAKTSSMRDDVTYGGFQ